MCLIPESAHGTNAASAVLAGLRVVVVKCGSDGAVDLGDLAAKLAAHAGSVAAIMVTYPSTNGVFEETIGEVCAAVHDAGGQVYVDGANLNALVGLARPAEFGADVSHLNLHKTFCIPHGGGGPGVGPVAVRGHLAPFLPGRRRGRPGRGGPVRVGRHPADLLGLHRDDGRRRAAPAPPRPPSWPPTTWPGGSDPHFPVLYTGRGGLVAHECILDLRPLTARTGVTAEDVAKRLIDYGFHAPTLSFPVAGTLMVEPTESEDLAELDRFCDAMIAIRAEIDRVAAGDCDGDDNPLRNAPHTGQHADQRRLEALLRPRAGRLPARHRAAAPSTGPRSAASTRPTATATSCAPAPRRRRSSNRAGGVRALGESLQMVPGDRPGGSRGGST